VQDAFSALTDYVEEAVTGIRVIKVFMREKDALRGLRERAGELQRRDIQLIRVWGLTGPLIDFLGSVSVLVLLWYGGILTTRGSFTIGGLVAFNTYIGMLSCHDGAGAGHQPVSARPGFPCPHQRGA